MPSSRLARSMLLAACIYMPVAEAFFCFSFGTGSRSRHSTAPAGFAAPVMQGGPMSPWMGPPPGAPMAWQPAPIPHAPYAPPPQPRAVTMPKPASVAPMPASARPITAEPKPAQVAMPVSESRPGVRPTPVRQTPRPAELIPVGMTISRTPPVSDSKPLADDYAPPPGPYLRFRPD